MPAVRIRARAPGRVNLIGDHTDYSGGYVFPAAIDRDTVVDFEPGGTAVELTSADEPSPAHVPVDIVEPSALRPPWARYIGGVVAAVRPAAGGIGTVATTVPIGAGLSSSAALEVAVALALGFTGAPLELAQACQHAEHLASGVPTGIMDQLASAAGRPGHALLIDCRSLAVTPVPLPESVALLVAHSGRPRTLVGSPYAERRAQCEAAAAIVGPLRDASLDAVNALDDDRLRRRARHVVTENARVLAFADALTTGDLVAAGRLMVESHDSLRRDYEVSTPELDALVARFLGTPGVYGARLTGAGFGGCVVALADRGTPTPEGVWRMHAAAGASVERTDG